MQVSRKQKTFSQFFPAFSKLSLIFEHFQKKDDSHSWCISKITESEKQGSIKVYKVPFKSSLNFEHFEKKDDSHTWGISEITDSEKHGYINN